MNRAAIFSTLARSICGAKNVGRCPPYHGIARERTIMVTDTRYAISTGISQFAYRNRRQRRARHFFRPGTYRAVQNQRVTSFVAQ